MFENDYKFQKWIDVWGLQSIYDKWQIVTGFGGEWYEKICIKKCSAKYTLKFMTCKVNEFKDH